MSIVEAVARAMMDGDLWPGAFDEATKYSGQDIERDVWRRRARLALAAAFSSLALVYGSESEPAQSAEIEF